MGIWLPIEMPVNCINCRTRGIATVTNCKYDFLFFTSDVTNRNAEIPEDCPIKEIRNIDGIFEQ